MTRMARSAVVVALACAALCTACAEEPATPVLHPVVKLAVFDLDCSRERIRYTEIDDSTWGVEGCGKRAKYVKDCRQVIDMWMGRPTGVHDDCHWVKN